MYSQFYNPYMQPQYQMQAQPDMNQYRPQMQQSQMVQTQMSLPNQDERIWVQGEEAAKAYLVAPNSFVRLWDTLKPVFYEKRSDSSGKPSIVAYEYAQANTGGQIDEKTHKDDKEYTEQLKSLYERLNALEERMSDYEQAESYYDDSRVPEIQEPIQRKSTAGSRKASPRG